MRDLEFISGQFFDCEVPKEKRFLLKYFTTELQMAFLRYYLVFDECRNFTQHTGYYCSERQKFKMQRRYRTLLDLHSRAKSALTEEGMEFLQLLESGRYVLTKNVLS